MSEQCKPMHISEVNPFALNRTYCQELLVVQVSHASAALSGPLVYQGGECTGNVCIDWQSYSL